MERLSKPATSTGISARIALTAVAITCLGATAFTAAAGAVRLAPLAHAEGTTTSQETSKPAMTNVYSVGNGVTSPRLVRQVDPDYPQELRNNKALQGECIIGLVVDKNGMPTEVHVKKSLGKGFDENAVAAVKQYRFKPGMRQGTAVPVALTIAVNYQTF